MPQIKFNEIDDKTLWEAIRYRNDASALESLFRSYYSKLRDFSTVLIKNSDEAGEIAADVFVKVWEKRAVLDIDNIKAYLFASTKNMSLNHLKCKNQSFDWENIDDLKSEVASEYNDPFRLLCEIEHRQVYDNLIDQLPAKRKIIFKLSRIDGLKYKEIADLLDISVRTVEDQMMLALKFLQASVKTREIFFHD